ncbi:hypothetical protein KAX97_14110 [candidate division WOR-3 bacterium]|nr:hypothetical protein [candidate division WOR-3 bacterium]
MAVRIREDRKTIVCAAKSEPREGDCYIDDNVHYVLGVEMKILCWKGTDENGADLWEFDTVNGEKRYEQELERA